MSADVIKEFLVSLSFSKDEAGFHRTMESVEGLTKKMVVLGGAIEAAAIASVAAIHRIAMGMEAVGYASSRIGASVSGIKEFQFAISQLGGTAAGAMSSLEHFSRFLRETPGGEAWLRNFGIQTRDAKGQLRDRKELLDAFFASNRFTKEDYWAKLRDAEFVGVDEDTMRAAMNPERHAREAEARAKYRNAGADPDKMAEAGKKFEQVWRSLGLTIDIICDKIAMAMAGPAGDKFRQLIDYLDRNSGRIADGLIVLGNAIVDCAGQLISWVGHVAEWEEKAEKWIAANPKIEAGLKAITEALGPLGTALAALATGVALRGLVGLLGLAGLGGLASFVSGGAVLAAGGALVGGALGAMTGSAGEGENEAARQENIANDPDYYKEGHPGGAPADQSIWGRVKRGLGFGNKESAETGKPTGGTAVLSSLTPQQRGLLDALTGPEGGGSYNIMIGGKHFSDYSHHPGNIFGTGSDAGRYQIVGSTWSRIQKALGLNDFSPENQDRAALWLAQQDYNKNTGRNLDSDLGPVIN
jgi:hypothetical protein